MVRQGPNICKSIFFAILNCAFLLPYAPAQDAQRSEIVALMRQKQYDAAEPKLFEVLRANPNTGWALDQLGTIRLQQKRNSEALALFQRAYSLDEHDVASLRGLGEATGRVSAKDAVQWYTKLLQVAPNDVSARKALANVQEQLHMYQESIATIDGIPPEKRSADLLPVLASDYINSHQEQKVAPLIAQILRAPNANPAVTLDFAAVLIRNGYVKDADALLKLARPAKPNAEYLHILARVREAQGQLDESETLLKKALELEPDSYDLLFDAARFYAQHERWNDVIKMLNRANAVKPDQPEVLEKLTLALLKTRRREIALNVARQLNAVTPDDPQAQYVLAFALVENELWEMAQPVARRAVQAKPNYAQNHLLMGIISLSLGDLDSAKTSLQTALKLDPNLSDAHYYSALVSERNGDIESARKELAELVKVAPNHAGGQAELGVLDLRAGDVQNARTALEQAVKLAPEVSQSHYQLGLVYARLGLQEESKAQMAEFQKLREAENDLRKQQNGVKTR
ncbi:MAG TPA: tetratricopeptide repeat protein [Terriglobales bacterium]